jgi:hypothetical protein
MAYGFIHQENDKLVTYIPEELTASIVRVQNGSGFSEMLV